MFAVKKVLKFFTKIKLPPRSYVPYNAIFCNSRMLR